MHIIFKDAALPGVALRNITPTQLHQSVRFSFNLHNELDSLEVDMHFYATEALKAIEICEERNL